MTLDEILSDLQNKVFCRSADIREFTKVEQILLENECTELLKKLLSAINKRCLRNFSLRIEMDVNDETLGGH
jgi:hypothetical protein